MTERVRFRPFTGTADKSVRLTDPPLAMVLCQVRWPALTTLSTPDQSLFRTAAFRFGEALPDFPLISETKSVNYVITPNGITAGEGGSVFQWSSVDGFWHVSLAAQFMSLYCTCYDGYETFEARLRPTLEVLRDALQIQLVDKVAIRYVNRLSDPNDIANLTQLIDAAVLGYPALSQQLPLRSTNQATYRVDDVTLQVRSGMIPAGETVDPAIAPVTEQSWILDLDASQEATQLLDTETVLKLASRLSDTGYDYFAHFIANEAFVARFSSGGSPS